MVQTKPQPNGENCKPDANLRIAFSAISLLEAEVLQMSVLQRSAFLLAAHPAQVTGQFQLRK